MPLREYSNGGSAGCVRFEYRNQVKLRQALPGGNLPGLFAPGKDRRRNNCRLPDVEHVFNVLGTMESRPTYFCSSPNHWPGLRCANGVS